MHTLHIDTGREMRGGQWQVFYLVRELRLRGVSTTLLAHAGSPLYAAAVSDGIEVRALSLREIVRSSASATLLHAHDAHAHTLGLVTRKPLIVSRRVAFPIRQGAFSRIKYRRATHYIAVSEFVRTTLMLAGVPGEDISVVYDGVVPCEGPVEALRTRVVAIDSRDPLKGRAILERAAAAESIPVQFSSNLSGDLPSAALFVYITELEGLGSAILLAMTCGAPVLASNTGGIPEIVLDGVTGTLVKNDVSEIAAKMRALLDHSDRALHMAAAAKARVDQQFSVERMTTGTIAVYERVLACSKRF